MVREFLDHTVPAADHRLYGILSRYLDDVLKRMPQPDELVATIRKAIGESLRYGTPKLERVAKSLAVSPRTLPGRLEKTGPRIEEIAAQHTSPVRPKILEGPGHDADADRFLVGILGSERVQPGV